MMPLSFPRGLRIVLITSALGGIFTLNGLPVVSAQGTVEALECPGVAPVDPALSPMDEELLESKDKAHRIATGRDVTIAIIDTGVSPHPRLPEVIPGGDFVGAHQQDDIPGELIDCDGHGTIIAGIISLTPNTGSGWPYDGTGDSHHGIAPDATLISIKQTSAFVRSSGDTGVGTLGTLAESIHRAIDMDANIINISVVSCVPPGRELDQSVTPLDQSLLRAEHEGVLVVAAAGNVSQDCPTGSAVYPAHFPTVLGVSARFDPHTIATYSVPSNQQLLSAQGLITAGVSPRGDGFARSMLHASGESPFEGTSFAAPVVSATAALIKQRHPHASPQEIRERILRSVDPARGAVDPYRALTFELRPSAEVNSREVVVAAPTPTDMSAVHRAWFLLCGLATLATVIAVVSGWWRSKRTGK